MEEDSIYEIGNGKAEEYPEAADTTRRRRNPSKRKSKSEEAHVKYKKGKESRANEVRYWRIIKG